MNISGDLTSSPYGFENLVSKARVGRDEGAPKDLFVSIAEKEEKQRQESRPGVAGLPGEMSEADKTRIEMLKSRAEAIVAQGEDELSAGQESELRDIQRQIRRISKMPMGENIVEKAKGQTAAKKAEKQAFDGQDGQAQDGDGLITDGQDRLDMADQPGERMLQQNAFVTSVKTARAAMSASSLKSRS